MELLGCLNATIKTDRPKPNIIYGGNMKNEIKEITEIITILQDCGRKRISRTEGVIVNNEDIATALYDAGYRKQIDTVKEFANIVISECEHLQEHCEEMNNNDAYDYVEILIAEINRQTEQYGKEEVTE